MVESCVCNGTNEAIGKTPNLQPVIFMLWLHMNGINQIHNQLGPFKLNIFSRIVAVYMLQVQQQRKKTQLRCNEGQYTKVKHSTFMAEEVDDGQSGGKTIVALVLKHSHPQAPNFRSPPKHSQCAPRPSIAGICFQSLVNNSSPFIRGMGEGPRLLSGADAF
jgi:hypothetical protein